MAKPQTIATRKYEAKASWISKSYKLKKEVVEEYASTDWSNKESTRAKMRTKIKECLKKYNYPPEYAKAAVDDVIKQAEYIMNDNK